MPPEGDKICVVRSKKALKKAANRGCGVLCVGALVVKLGLTGSVEIEVKIFKASGS